MPKFLDTRGLASLAIGICDRCQVKYPFVSLSPDTNFPGLRVCNTGCKDKLDPYRLPARKTERINLRFPRPDLSITVADNNLITGDGWVISPQQNTQIPENSGNLDSISVSPG